MHYKDILESYYKVNEDKPEESAKKLHNVVDKILKQFGGITDIDRDECYSIANLEITKYIKSQLDKGIEDFDEDNSMDLYILQFPGKLRCILQEKTDKSVVKS